MDFLRHRAALAQTRLIAVSALLLLASCSTLQENAARRHSSALAPTVDTASARYIDAERDKHPEGQSGFRLLTLSTNALMSRVALAASAERSLDLQYFIFRDDDTGQLIAQQLLKAADRGVRVRVLVDDMKIDEEARLFEALDSHPMIEVRLFNPFNTHRPGAISRTVQLMLDFRRLNRRMHNKSFIADNKVAIVGGRNIGDDYFDADEKSNFRDLDLLAIGPVVREASRSFDEYWNNPASFPISGYPSAYSERSDLAEFRLQLDAHARGFEQSDYAQAVLEELPDGATADRQGQWFWGPAVLVADQPQKIEDDDDKPGLRMAPRIQQMLDVAQTEVLAASPYFVPGDQDKQALIALAKRGVTTQILTNSLASTDQPAVHAGYSARRRDLLAGGVQLFELKPVAGVKQTLAQTGSSSGVSLHAKTMVVDRRYVFIGSMNMDQRSELLNTEMGFIVDSPALAKAVVDFLATISLPANAYRVELEHPATKSQDGGGQLVWKTNEGGKDVILTSEPGASPARRVEVLLMKILPIDSLL